MRKILRLFLFWLVWYRYVRQFVCPTMIFRQKSLSIKLFCFGMKQLEKKQFHLFWHFYWLNASNSLIPVGWWLKFVQSWFDQMILILHSTGYWKSLASYKKCENANTKSEIHDVKLISVYYQNFESWSLAWSAMVYKSVACIN